MARGKEIRDGWRNLLFKKEDVEKVAAKRLEICTTCPKHSSFHKTIRPDAHCVTCGCTLKAKVRSLESECPIGKWPALNEEDEKSKEE